MNQKARGGKGSELIVAGELVRRNVDVYLPCVDDRGVDIVVRAGSNKSSKYYEIQVKSVKGYNRIIGLRGLSEKPPSYLLVIHYRHDKKQDEFFWLTKDQARKHAVEAGWGDVVFNAPERERYKAQTLDSLAEQLADGRVTGIVPVDADGSTRRTDLI